MTSQTADRVGLALGRIPSGCAILTARTASARTGMLASWVQQVAFEPPMVAVAVKKGRPIEAVIEASGAFVLNLLSANPSAMFKHFGKGFSPEEDAFAGLDVRDVPGGVVIPDQIAWLSARVHGCHDAGDHRLYVARVVDGGLDAVLPPYVHLRKSGFSY
ncbi:MAG: flavin reductase family protein [Phycisphaerae bacterium]